MHPWPELKWWNSGERQVVEERLDDFKRTGSIYNPEHSQLYRALSATPEADVRVAILGQDPYPAHDMATGVAFSVPRVVLQPAFPQTLRIIFDEYRSDLGYDIPSHGELTRWTSRGVLLWNAIPACLSGKSLSCDWDEWSYLTGEIIDRLSTRGVVFALLGGVAGRFESRIDLRRNRCIRVSHPSPRGIRSSKSPFTGSRLFSTINARLVELEKEPIDWELPRATGRSDRDEPPRKRNIQTSVVGGGVLLPNITGAKLGGLKGTGTSRNIYTSLAF